MPARRSTTRISIGIGEAPFERYAGWQGGSRSEPGGVPGGRRSILAPAATACEGQRPVSETTEWAIPDAAQPKAADCGFDLERALSAVLTVRSEVPEDAFTASILGTERAGNGVMIGANGLVLTIGYLIT